jgi:glucuronoarabinoxylan endo-1,4-beta-xylanase
VALLATISAGNGSGTGIFTFYDGSNVLGTAQAANNTGSLSVKSFGANTTHQLTASYSGDALHAASTSPVVTLTVAGATAPGTISVHASFALSAPSQTISGFGAAEAFDLPYLSTAPYASEMYKALFDPTAGLGLSFLRIQNLYRGTPTNFDTDTPKIVAAANAASGTPLTLLMSSWSPPANLKSNGSVNGCTSVTNGVCTGGVGTLATANGSYNYSGFAQYWYDSLNAYAALNVVPAYISIQNEPDFSATYTGCRFNPTEAPYYGASYAGYGLAFDAVYKKLQTLTAPPKMVGPETLSASTSALDFTAQIPASELGAVAHHLYNVSSGSATNTGAINPGGNPDTGIPALTTLNSTYPTQLKFMTEYYDTPGFYNALNIHNALVYGNENAYIFWQAVWPSQLTTAKDQSADQQGLLYADSPTTNTPVFNHGWTYNDSYYALKQFSYFIRPGYARYTATVDNANERASVYQSADKKTTVIVILNVSSTATDGLSLDLSSIPYTTSAIYRSTFSQPITTGERFTSLGSYVAPSGVTTNTSGGIALPPQSVVTVVLKN